MTYRGKKDDLKEDGNEWHMQRGGRRDGWKKDEMNDLGGEESINDLGGRRE
jgi:hypothetical protein